MDEDEDDWDLPSDCDTACLDDAWEEFCAEEPTLCAEIEEAYEDEMDESEDWDSDSDDEDDEDLDSEDEDDEDEEEEDDEDEEEEDDDATVADAEE